MSPEDFREEVVQRMIVGPTASGGNLEVMYANSGTVQGIGSYVALALAAAPISGEWKIGDDGTICTSMRIGGAGGGGGLLPPRCQFWFKYADQYFLSDSDSDRMTKVLRRTVKQ